MTRAIDDFTGAYGPDWVRGILIDDLDRAVEAGAVARRTDSGATWVVLGKSPAVRVVCGDLVPVQTEDGTIDGRCGAPVVGDRGACTLHAEERDAYLATLRY
jgi:hypothetical protein